MTTRVHSVFWLATPGAQATIPTKVAQRLVKKYGRDGSDKLPYDNFLQDLVDELKDISEIKCTKKGCKTTNDPDASYCKRCGTALNEPDEVSEIFSIKWDDEEGNYVDERDLTAANTFLSIFVAEVVPHVKGYILGGIDYVDFTGDDSDEESDYQTAYFTIEDGKFDWCTLAASPGAAAPEFKLNEDDAEDDDEEEEDEEEEDDS